MTVYNTIDGEYGKFIKIRPDEVLKDSNGEEYLKLVDMDGQMTDSGAVAFKALEEVAVKEFLSGLTGKRDLKKI